MRDGGDGLLPVLGEASVSVKLRDLVPDNLAAAPDDEVPGIGTPDYLDQDPVEMRSGSPSDPRDLRNLRRIATD